MTRNDRILLFLPGPIRPVAKQLLDFAIMFGGTEWEIETTGFRRLRRER